jgi:hypothetical protein
MNPFVNQFNFSHEFVDSLGKSEKPTTSLTPLPHADHSAFTLNPLLSPEELVLFDDELARQSWIAVGKNGILRDYKEGDRIGSYRASAFEPEVADLLWERLSPFFPQVRHFDELDATDWKPNHLWKPVGLNPLLRFISYEEQGLLVPHYDAPYEAPDGARTLVTIVIYLHADKTIVGGATRFIKDPQLLLPHEARDYSDRDEFARDDEIIASVSPIPGQALLFDHRLLHDSEPLSGSGRKVILRSDVVFEKVKN